MTLKKRIAAIACIAFLLVYNTTHAQQNSRSDLSTARKSIAKSNGVYFELYAKNDNSILRLYTEDACLLAPNAPAICGRAALEKDFHDTFASGKVKSGKFTTRNVYGDGKEYVTEEGTWQVFDANGKLLDDGKYLKLWKATKEGWKILRDSFNSDHSPK